MRIFVDYAITEDCVNDEAMEMCLQCNQCGRFDLYADKESEDV